MLSAFTARLIIELRQRDKTKIETILTTGDRVLVGLNTGALRIYRLNDLPPLPSTQNGETHASSPPSTTDGDRPPSRASTLKPTDLLREVEKFSTRAIDQLAIIKEANTIVSLSNYHVSLHDLQTYEPIETLSRTKNASCFAVTSNIVNDPDTGINDIISRLAVAVKRRLLLWRWQESELADDVTEIVLAESIRTVTWASATKIVCGMNSGYVMVDAVTGQAEDVVNPGTVGASSQGSRFGAVSSAGMGYMGLGGYMPKPLAAKLADGEMLLAKDVNTLFIDDSGKFLERKQIPWSSAPESIGYSYPYILALQPPSKGSLEVRNPDTLSLLQNISLPGAAQLHFPPPSLGLAHTGKGFHISSERCVWKMEAIDYDSQVAELVNNDNYDEAISVLNMLEDALLRNKAETLMEVKMVKAEMLFRKRKFQQSMDLFNEDDVHAPPERVLRLFPREIAGEYSGYKEDEESAEGKANGTLSKNADTDDGDDKDKDQGSMEDQPLEGKELMKAVSELSSFLAGTRARLQRVIDPVTGQLKQNAEKNGASEDAAERFLRTTKTQSEKELEEGLRQTFRLVDTTLFKAYMYSKPYLAGSLFRIPNFCDPGVVNEKLLEHNRYNELIDFFYGKKLHNEALDLLRRFGAASRPDDAAPTLHGPDRAIQYLQKLDPSYIDLIFEHAKWTLEANAEYAMEIFVGDTENAETLPRDKVVAFLRDIDPKLEGQYLEHIINELDDMTPDLHNRLVEIYVQTLKKMKRGDEWDAMMERFVAFLGAAKWVYSLGRAFQMIPKDDSSFYEAQAVVLSKMGQHKQALEIFVYKMKDYSKAEEYCNRVYRTQTSSDTEDSSDDTEEPPPSIYHTLLSLYLQPPSSEKQRLEPALDLMSRHGSRLPATSTLSLIPPDLPISSLESYFRGRIRSANTTISTSRILLNLRTAERTSVAARLHLGDDAAGGQGGRNRHVTITEERHCVVCHKKLGGAMGRAGGGSVVAVMPDNTVVHYGCQGRLGGGQKEAMRAPSWSRGF